MQGFSYQQEVGRKLIHLTSLWMPGVILFCPRGVALGLLAGALLLVAVFELLRRSPSQAGRFIAALAAPVLRPEENAGETRLSGALPMLASALLVGALFDPLIAGTALAVLMISDSAAALVGRAFGRHKILDKSLEGCAAFWLSGAGLVLAMQPGDYWLSGLLAVSAATATELVSKRCGVDDNFSIPLVFCGVQASLLALA